MFMKTHPNYSIQKSFDLMQQRLITLQKTHFLVLYCYVLSQLHSLNMILMTLSQA